MIVKDLIETLARKKGYDPTHYFYNQFDLMSNEYKNNIHIILFEYGYKMDFEKLQVPLVYCYWVYSYVCCLDWLEFFGFESKEEAQKYYQSLSINDLVTDKLFIDLQEDT